MAKKKTEEAIVNETTVELKVETKAKSAATKKPTTKSKANKSEKTTAPEVKTGKVFGTVDRDEVFASVMGYDKSFNPGKTPEKKEKVAKKPAKKTTAKKKSTAKIVDVESKAQLDNKLKAVFDDLVTMSKTADGYKLNQTDFDEKVMETGISQDENEKLLFALQEIGIEIIDDLTDEFDFESGGKDTSFLREEKTPRESRSDISYDPVKQYLREIGQIPLLTGEQEIMIAQRITKGIAAEEEIKKDMEKGDGDSSKLTEYELEALEAERDDGRKAKQNLAEANLRLVVSIAKKYTNRGMQFLDLIQEGNLGLLKAVDKFDYTRGYKFSTYATWWIRQAITRSIADQGRTIRIPVHMVETINKVKKASAELLHELDREATPEEIAERLAMPEDKVREVLRVSQEPVSLETPIGEEEDSHLGDFIPDEDSLSPADVAAQSFQRQVISDVLHTLTDREREVIEMRFGLKDGDCKTLEEVGDHFHVTRERIRQIEAKALRKLRHPSRSKRLKDL